MELMRSALVAGFVLALALAVPGAAQVRPEVRRTASGEVARVQVERSLTEAELRRSLSDAQRARFEQRGNALVARLVAARAFDRELTTRERRQVERYVGDLARALGRDPGEVREAAWELAATRLEERRALLAANEHVLRRARHLAREGIAILRRAARAGTDAVYVRPTLEEEGERLRLREERTTTSSDDALEAMREMQSMNQSFDMQYLALQQQMAAENREFVLLSNIMKTKHETARTAIQNVR